MIENGFQADGPVVIEERPDSVGNTVSGERHVNTERQTEPGHSVAAYQHFRQSNIRETIVDDERVKLAAGAGGGILLLFIVLYFIGWLPTGTGTTFNKADGAVLACYSEFSGIDTERVRKIDWIEFSGSVEGRLKPLLTDKAESISEDTTKAAELLIEIAATHPIKEREKVEQYAITLAPLIQKIRE